MEIFIFWIFTLKLIVIFVSYFLYVYILCMHTFFSTKTKIKLINTIIKNIQFFYLLVLVCLILVILVLNNYALQTSKS